MFVIGLLDWRRSASRLQSGVLSQECERCILHWSWHLSAADTQCL